MNLGDWVRDVVTTGGYPGLTLLIVLESVFPPIPSEVILPLAGFYVGRGDLNFGLTVLAATVGSMAGALLIYALACRGDRPLLLRHARLLRLRGPDLDRADEWFDRYGGWLVLGGRLVPGARSLISVPAGMSEIPLIRFIVLTALGSALWNAALVVAGWALGRNYDQVSGVVGPAGTAAVIALVVVAGILALQWRRRRDAQD